MILFYNVEFYLLLKLKISSGVCLAVACFCKARRSCLFIFADSVPMLSAKADQARPFI